MVRSFNDLVLLCLLLALSACGEDPSKQFADPKLGSQGVELIAADLSRSHSLKILHAVQEDQLIQLHFISKLRLDLQSARQLMTECTGDLLSWLPPIDVRQLDFSIAFRKTNGDHMDPPAVAYAYLYEGNIYYSTYDEEGLRLRKLHKESLDEAMGTNSLIK